MKCVPDLFIGWALSEWPQTSAVAAGPLTRRVASSPCTAVAEDLVSLLLARTGIRIVTGMNKDTSGSSSNGAGKTYLVMAPLWALTGFLVGEKSMDGQTNLTRIEQALDVKVVSKSVIGICAEQEINDSTQEEINSVLGAENVLLHAMAEYARLTMLKRLACI
eukprot:SM000001S04642  [mRNA]  locus=s1:1465793:1468555:+ [translate_table: standard]